MLGERELLGGRGSLEELAQAPVVQTAPAEEGVHRDGGVLPLDRVDADEEVPRGKLTPRARIPRRRATSQ